MIILSGLIAILILLLAVFSYFNVKGRYKSNVSEAGEERTPVPFASSADYFEPYHSWLELIKNSMKNGEICYINNNCTSDICRHNPDTNQTLCFDTEADAVSEGYSENSPNQSLPAFNYGTNTLYTSICAQKSTEVGKSALSYYPDFKSTTLVNEIPANYTSSCGDFTFQQSPLTSTSSTSCYDADQLAGTKIVEVCQAPPESGSICLDSSGDRVYSPSLNPIYIKPLLKLCDNNTSINYLSFNFNNTPQTIEVLTSDIGSGASVIGASQSLINNQLQCLSVDSVTYYPNIKITKSTTTTDTILTFEGTWGTMYSYILSSGSSISAKSYSTDADVLSAVWYDLENGKIFSTEDSADISYNLGIDFNYGISYKIPSLVVTTAGIKLGSFSKVYTYGETIDVTAADISFSISSEISLKPCAMFDSTYSQGEELKTLSTSNVDKQKFKVSRYEMSNGALTPATTGMVSSVVYRNLNFLNGGLYLDYYALPSDSSSAVAPSSLPVTGSNGITTADGLILRKVNQTTINASRKWILMHPLNLSPYSIPSGSSRWCNYNIDESDDGGTNFNGKTGTVVPMKSTSISTNTEIIDPKYLKIKSQPDNKLFEAVGDFYSINQDRDPFKKVVDIYKAIKSPNANWHLINEDPSFAACAQLCDTRILSIPQVKAVAYSVSGDLGSTPPGHNRGITNSFAEGDVIDGYKIAGATCQNYFFYSPILQFVPPIEHRGVGTVFTDGDVNFVVKSTYEDTYLFDTDYFNSKNVLTISSIITGGSNYGTTAPPQNVITSLTPQDKIFQNGTTSVSSTNFTTACANPTSPAGPITGTGFECTLSGVSFTDLCAYSGDEILNQVMKNLNGKSWAIKNSSSYIPIVLQFSKAVCNNPTLGLLNFYSVELARIGFSIEQGSVSNTVDISGTDLSTYFPSTGIDPSETDTSYQVFAKESSTSTTYTESLYDIFGAPLSLTLETGNFSIEYRLFFGTTYVAEIIPNITSGVITGASDIVIVNVVNSTVLASNISGTFTIQEWWVVPTVYAGYTVNIEYHNTTASGCTVKVSEGDDVWGVTKRAPSNLLKSDNQTLQFQEDAQPMSLLNNSLLKHGPSPQQMVYAGSFQEEDRYCNTAYSTIDTCNADPVCSFNSAGSYCEGKNLLEFSETIGPDVFTTTQSFDPSYFNEKSNDVFTSLVFLKSLQIDTLNYQSYIPNPGQSFVGGSGGNENYFTVPNFVNYSNQGYRSSDTDYTLKLGKFIPYQYFYSSFIDPANGQEASTVTSPIPSSASAYVPYINLNYSQMMPYGKKELYRNGFSSMADAPTF
jgi:hypothetical protein